jgi:hypothetical protein
VKTRDGEVKEVETFRIAREILGLSEFSCKRESGWEAVSENDCEMGECLVPVERSFPVSFGSFDCKIHDFQDGVVGGKAALGSDDFS